MLQKILKWWILGLIFLLPLFWLPFTFEFIEFNKLYLLFFLGWTGILIWFLKMIIRDKEIRIRWGIFDFLVLTFLLIGVVSSILSLDKFSSLFGTYGRFSDGLFALLSFFALYLLVRNNIVLEKKAGIKRRENNEKKEGVKTERNKRKKEAREGEGLSLNEIFGALFVSAFIVVLWIWVWLIFGVKLAGFFERREWVFTPVGRSAYGAGIYLALMVILILLKALFEKQKLLGKIVYTLFLILTIPLILIFDYSPCWIILGLGFIFFVALSLKAKIFREDIHKLILPIFLVFLSALFLLLNFRVLISGLGAENLPIFRYPLESVLWQRESWEIGFKGASQDLKSVFVGSGPGTFLLDYSKFKSEKMNSGDLWSIRFDRAGNNVAEILATMGFLGLIGFALMMGFALFIMIKSQLNQRKKLTWGMFLAGLIIAQFVFYQNMVISGLFFLALGIAGNFGPLREKRYSFKESPEIGLIFETVTIVLFLLLVAGYFYGIKFYLADLNYRKMLFEPETDKKTELIQKATQLNPYQTNYQIVSSQVLLRRLQEEILKPQEKQNQNLIRSIAQNMFFYAQRAKTLSPNSVNTYQNLGNIYRDLVGIAQGEPEKQAISEYTKAIELEPKNPILYTERGKIYFRMEKVEEAKKDFQRAIELAPQYLDAQIQMTFVEEHEGKRKEGIKRLEGLAQSYPYNLSLDLLFRLGWLYYNDKQYDNAISTLERVTLIAPNHANALFILALAYQQKGDDKKAIELLERVASLNPGNKEVEKKLKELKGGEQVGGKEEEEVLEEEK
jgi:tetratricopeptide (TPR) repeat protein